MRYKWVLWIFICCTVNAQKGNIEKAGDVLQVALPALAGMSTLLNDNGPQDTWQFTKSYATTLAITYGLKYTINAKRPNGGNYSFPSGHTASAFSGASFIQRRYGWTYGAPAYLLAGYVGWSRIEANKHHTFDVIAGATLGILSTYLFTKNPKRKDKRLQLTFLETDESLFRLRYTF